MALGRRVLLSMPAVFSASRGWAAPGVRVGTLRFGSVAWELDVMRHHGLAGDTSVEAVEFAASQATQVALQAGRVDVIVGDWLWVSRQRAAGADWTWSATSAALGAVMTPADSPVRGIMDLPGRRLGIAGTPLDKSWLLLRAYTQRTAQIDLDTACEKTFGPPPLLAEQVGMGRLDAVLTYWPYAARAAAAGQRQVVAMDDVWLRPLVPGAGCHSWARSSPVHSPPATRLPCAPFSMRRPRRAQSSFVRTRNGSGSRR